MGRAGDFGVIIQVVVRIVHPSHGEADIAYLELVTGLIAVVPTVLHEGRTHAAPGKVQVGGLALFAQQVLEGIDRLRCPVVIGAEDEEAGAGQQRTESAQRIGYGLLIGEIIAGVDYEVRLQGVEGGDPGNLGLLARDHVQIRKVEQPKFRLATQSALGQERERIFLELEFGQFAIAPCCGAQARSGEAAKNT